MIGQLTPGDGELATFELGIERRPITSEDVRAVREGMVDRMVSQSRDARAAQVEAMPVPDSMPFLSDLKLDSSCRVWVQEYVATTDVTQRWTGFDSSGGVVGTLTMEAGIELRDMGEDYAIVETSDELDVPEIRMHALVPASGGR